MTKRFDSMVRRIAPVSGSTWWIFRSRYCPTQSVPSAHASPEPPPPGAGMVHSLEFQDLRTRWQKAQRTPPQGVPRPQAAPAKATTTPRTTVIEEQVLEAAEQVRGGGATPTEQRIADRLHMKLADLRKFLRDNPRTKYQLQQIAKESA